jgi:hypothetical protein
MILKRAADVAVGDRLDGGLRFTASSRSPCLTKATACPSVRPCS